MLQWNPVRRRDAINNVLAKFTIPVRIKAPKFFDLTENWTIEVFGGTVDNAIERMDAKCNDIVTRFHRHGVDGINKQEALFVHACKWVQSYIHDPEQHDHNASNDAEYWLIIYATMGNTFLN